MFDVWNGACLALGDAALGWILDWPSDVVLLTLAVLTGSMMALVRPITTNQDLLRRVDRDRRRLKELIAEAKRTGDRSALERYRTTGTQLSLRKLRAEFLPLLVVLGPVAILATWAMQRVEFHPPREHEPIEIVVYAPLSSGGDVMHLIPRSGLFALTGWVRPIEFEPVEPGWFERSWAQVMGHEVPQPEPNAVATWQVHGKARRRPYSLIFRHRDQTIAGELLIGQRTYAPAWVVDDKSGFTIEQRLREVRLFGLVPGIAGWLPAWMVGYLLLAIPLLFVLKSAMRIY